MNVLQPKHEAGYWSAPWAGQQVLHRPVLGFASPQVPATHDGTSIAVCIYPLRWQWLVIRFLPVHADFTEALCKTFVARIAMSLGLFYPVKLASGPVRADFLEVLCKEFSLKVINYVQASCPSGRGT